MTIDIVKKVMEMRSYSSPRLRESLLRGFEEKQEESDSTQWMLFLADE
jgi:hypothetical protein